MPLSGFLQDWQKTLAQNAYALLRQLTSLTQLFLPSAMYVTAIFHGKHPQTDRAILRLPVPDVNVNKGFVCCLLRPALRSCMALHHAIGCALIRGNHHLEARCP